MDGSERELVMGFGLICGRKLIRFHSKYEEANAGVLL
jgi:hypothetical protein